MVVERLCLPWKAERGQRLGDKRESQDSRQGWLQQVARNLPCKQIAKKAVSRQQSDLHGEGKTHSLESRMGCADFELMETKPGKKVVPKKRQ